jgi:hypothetical protein
LCRWLRPETPEGADGVAISFPGVRRGRYHHRREHRDGNAGAFGPLPAPDGVATFTSHKGLTDNRAGHGWDRIADLGNGSYSGRKGGSLPTIGCWVQFKGDWGFVMNWATKAISLHNGVDLGEFMPPVMQVAKTEKWPRKDLFPAYGLASL